MEASFASPFDQVVWDWAEASRPLVLGEARAAAILLNRGHEAQISFETIYTSGAHPFDCIHPSGVSAVRTATDGVQVLRMEDDEGPWVLVALPTGSAGVFHLVSGLPATHSRSKKVERWLARSRDVSRCFLDHDDFASIGDRLAEWGEVEVVKLSARMIKDGSSVNRGFPPHTGVLRPTHRDGLSEVEALGASVRTLTLSVTDTMHVHLRRVAGATLYSGSYEVFEDQVLTRLESATADRRAMLADRERRALMAPLRPLTVRLPSPFLANKRDTEAVLALISDMANVSMAVFHRNPYLHVAVTDEFDGSNFDVMITRPDAIDVFPGYRASSSALGRVTRQLSERFGALDLGERPEHAGPLLADLAEG